MEEDFLSNKLREENNFNILKKEIEALKTKQEEDKKEINSLNKNLLTLLSSMNSLIQKLDNKGD